VGAANFPPSLASYADGHFASVADVLAHRIQVEPFNLVATVIFLCAILHTFFANRLNHWAHARERAHRERLAQLATADGPAYAAGREPVSFSATLLHFLGEVEAIFGIWAVVLFTTIFFWFGWDHVTHYVDHVNFAEPLFVVVVMAIAATRPVVKAAETSAGLVARLAGGSPAAWWLAILFLLPPLGSFITEPAAMTIAAMLLSQKFYELEPSSRFKYATLGLLFVNISIGGTLTHFAAPPVLMVAEAWKLDAPIMLSQYGWKALLGIALSNALYFVVFRADLAALRDRARARARDQATRVADEPVPVWVTAVHVAFLAFTVLALHHPPLVVGCFLFFLAFTAATGHHQYELSIRGPLLVGFFLAALVVHGGFQQWWIAPVLSSLGELPLFLGSIALTAFNDNAAITYLASLVPALDPARAADPIVARALQYSVLAGAVAGGGLTVIANAPNPAGQSLLARHFAGGISPGRLFAGALAPTVIVALCFWALR